jgi:hypothetical protein
MSTAPVCPISRSEPFPGHIVKEIQQLTHAHDLASAIRLLNQLLLIISHLTRGAPHFNNTVTKPLPDIVIPGKDPNPHYGPANWIEEDRVYDTRQLVNPDNQDQIIELKTLSKVTFFNPNTEFRLDYRSGS